VAKTKVICVAFFLDVACQKLSKSATVSRSYLKNKERHVFVDHGVLRWRVIVVVVHVASDQQS